jgi:hypothetical protein
MEIIWKTRRRVSPCHLMSRGSTVFSLNSDSRKRGNLQIKNTRKIGKEKRRPWESLSQSFLFYSFLSIKSFAVALYDFTLNSQHFLGTNSYSYRQKHFKLFHKFLEAFFYLNQIYIPFHAAKLLIFIFCRYTKNAPCPASHHERAINIISPKEDNNSVWS